MNKRVNSIDIIRGLAIALMIVVNTHGSWKTNFSQLSHAPWNGITLADFAFPFFIISLGVAVPISIKNKISKNKSNAYIIVDIIKRSIILFLFGLFLNYISNKDLSTIRIMGVLQRLGIVYLATSLVYLLLAKITDKTKMKILWLIVLSTTIIIAYYIIGLPFGFSEQGNLASIVDTYILKNHLYTPTFDPEGLLTTVVSISSGLLGCILGCIIIDKKIEENKKFTQILLLGIVCTLGGLIFNKYFPFNKRLWSSSFVLITAGSYGILLSLLYFICDIKQKYKIFMPIIALGSSPIFIYMLSEIINRTKILSNIILFNVDSFNFMVIYMLVWIFITSIMYYKKIFIKI